MSSTRSLQYSPLSRTRAIRLVAVKPSFSALQPIVCSLKQVFLEDYTGENARSNYEALSYTWGAREGTVPITCDGQTLLVTPNCESALRYLRQRFTERLLWIDAICIDQKSVEEKNQQVPLMGEIYSLAKRVVIWLGSGLAGDEALLNKARIGGAMFHVRDQPGRNILSDRHKQWGSKLISPEDIERVRRICSHEWFQRMWTMQELLLAESAVFQIGSTECPTSALYTYFLVAEALVDSESSGREVFRMRSRALEIVNPKAVEKAGWVMSTVTTINMSVESRAEELFGMLLSMAATAEASNVRDKVYGMVGLLDAVYEGFVLPDVDYNKTVPEVFEAFTRGCIETTETLWPLEIMAQWNRRPSDLPSWVPDLRDPTAICLDWWPTTSRYTHREDGLEVFEVDEPGRLPVRARYLARVEEVYTRMPVCEKDASDGELLRTLCLSEWTAVAASLEEEFAGDEDCFGNFLFALERMTWGLDTIRNKHEPPQVAEPVEEEEQTGGWFSRRWSSDSLDDKGSSAHVQSRYDGAVLFRTSCGLLGLSKGDVQAGDKIAQLACGRYPFILRRVSIPDDQDFPEYEFVGVTDVHGLGEKGRRHAWSEELVNEGYYTIVLV